MLSTGEMKELGVTKMNMIEEKGAIICSDSAYLSTGMKVWKNLKKNKYIMN